MYHFDSHSGKLYFDSIQSVPVSKRKLWTQLWTFEYPSGFLSSKINDLSCKRDTTFLEKTIKKLSGSNSISSVQIKVGSVKHLENFRVRNQIFHISPHYPSQCLNFRPSKYWHISVHNQRTQYYYNYAIMAHWHHGTLVSNDFQEGLVFTWHSLRILILRLMGIGVEDVRYWKVC